MLIKLRIVPYSCIVTLREGELGGEAGLVVTGSHTKPFRICFESSQEGMDCWRQGREAGKSHMAPETYPSLPPPSFLAHSLRIN
jgi:hypothetical protein